MIFFPTLYQGRIDTRSFYSGETTHKSKPMRDCYKKYLIVIPFKSTSGTGKINPTLTPKGADAARSESPCEGESLSNNNLTSLTLLKMGKVSSVVVILEFSAKTSFSQD